MRQLYEHSLTYGCHVPRLIMDARVKPGMTLNHFARAHPFAKRTLK